jgi:hypothetical protein
MVGSSAVVSVLPFLVGSVWRRRRKAEGEDEDFVRIRDKRRTP